MNKSSYVLKYKGEGGVNHEGDHMKTVIKGFVICLAASIVIDAKIYSMDQSEEIVKTEHLINQEKLVILAFDEQGNVTTRIIDSPEDINVLNTEISHLTTQNKKEYKHGLDMKINHLLNTPANEATKLILEGLYKGIYGLTILVLHAGKFFIVKTGEVTLGIIKKIFKGEFGFAKSETIIDLTGDDEVIDLSEESFEVVS